MPRSTYTSAFKTKIVLEVLREEKELGEIAAEHNLNPNMVRNWKREFLENWTVKSSCEQKGSSIGGKVVS